MQLPSNYYHCFLGNGLDAVLVGYTGSMVSDKVSVDRCNWYKADRYYPEDKLVMVAGRFPIDKRLEHAEGSGWYEVAPLGRSWYTLLDGARPLELVATEQRFVPQEGTLYTKVDYGTVKGEVRTWLHARRSILIEEYTFDGDVDFQAWMGPGVWMDDGWDTDPFRSVEMNERLPEGRYDLGETHGIMQMRLDPQPEAFGADGNDRWARARGRTFVKYFSIVDNRQDALDGRALDEAIALGLDTLRDEHLTYWRHYFAASSITIPDEQYQYFYEASMYHFKAAQNRESGGLPVNNLRRTWSSHIFWDSYFIQRALMEAHHTAEALEANRFFQRTIDHARRHASEEFGCDGLKWDWEITHDGRKAYGTLLHMKYQVHNNGSYANMIMGYYDFTQDEDYLREFYPILEGLARFFLDCIVQKTDDGYGVGYVVGVHESPDKVLNDGSTVTGTIVILRHLVRAARILGKPEDDFIRECAAVGQELTKTVDRLYNGQFFRSSESQEHINASSVAPIHPMGVVAAKDPRAVSTVHHYLKINVGRVSSFPWSGGRIGTVLAEQGNGDLVWEVLDSMRPTICQIGGMAEVMQNNGEWNMQYFGTAQGATCTAIHQLLLQSTEEGIELFPAVPSAWDNAAFNNLLARGLSVTARYNRAGGVEWTVRNDAPEALTRQVRFGDHAVTLVLQPGEERQGAWG